MIVLVPPAWHLVVAVDETLGRRKGERIAAKGMDRDGRTLYAYLTDRRLETAHVCLRDSQSTLKTVAAHLGYASVSHFSHAFIRKFGDRPGQLRPPAPGDDDAR